MIYLIAAVLCSSMISIIMRLSQEKRKSDVGMFIFNYAVCSLLGFLYTPHTGLSFGTDGMAFTLGLGMVSGILFLASFFLFQQGIKKNGMMLASIFMKLGVIIPVLMSILVFGESPKTMQILGILLSVIAIIVFNYDREEKARGGSILFLILLLAVSGFTDSTINIYDKAGNSSLSDLFLLLVFLFAGISSAAVYCIRREKMDLWDVLFGILIGIPNYYSSRFLLLSLKTVPAVAAYPIYSVATIVVISLAGILAFRESVSKQKIIGLVLVAAAVTALA